MMKIVLSDLMARSAIINHRGARHCVPVCLYLACCVLCVNLCGCGGSVSLLELPTASKGYVLYVFARKTEVMIDLCKSDGVSRGTRFDIFRMDVPGMDDPVKMGEVTVEEVGRRMSKAKVTAITSSLDMERGDRVLPHPLVIVSDGSWLTSRRPVEGWRSDTSSSDERSWETCEVLPYQQVDMKPEFRQLVADTDAKPIWHPSVKSHHGDVFFRKVFQMDAVAASATMKVVCGGRTNIYLNDRWVGEAKEWPEISSFRVHALLSQGRNVIGVHTVREPRTIAPPVLFLALTVQTEFE